MCRSFRWATNLGCFWQQEEMAKTPGKAVIEFLPPIQPGLAKDAFLSKLTERVESGTAELVAEARGWDTAKRAVLIPDPAKGESAKPQSGVQETVQ